MFDTLLRPRLPAAAADYVAGVLRAHPCDVRLSRPRRTKLGDHRPPGRGRPRHRITVNEDLNPYAFLTTLLHEVAHAAAWQQTRDRWRRPRPHGPEWQQAFGDLLAPVVVGEMLPDDVRTALVAMLDRPTAASCSDRGLALALARYDAPRPGLVRVEELATGAIFRTECGMIFRAGPIVRTRRQCHEWPSGREYRVHRLARVEPLATVPEQPVSGRPGRSTGRSGRCGASSRLPARRGR